jgi:hypothetical protein
MFTRTYTACILMLAIALVFPAGLLAQDQNNPEVLRKELADALGQLKSAQDRKNELATENEKLKAQIAAMQKELDERRAASLAWAEQTYSLRAQHQAWVTFLDHYPNLKMQWELFLLTPPLVVNNQMPRWHDGVIGNNADGDNDIAVLAGSSTSAGSAPGATPSTAPSK